MTAAMAAQAVPHTADREHKQQKRQLEPPADTTDSITSDDINKAIAEEYKLELRSYDFFYLYTLYLAERESNCSWVKPVIWRASVEPAPTNRCTVLL